MGETVPDGRIAAGAESGRTLAAVRWSGDVAASFESDLPQLLGDSGVPGVQVALVDGGEIWSRSVGVARRDPDVPVSDGTVFQGASLSKPIFATAVLLTVADGTLDLDTPLSNYLTLPPEAASEGVEAVTARHCLTHTAGFGAFYDGQLRVHHRPGERFSYSGIGYEYLGHVMRTVWDEPVDAAIRRLVLAPAQAQGWWRKPEDEHDLAVGYNDGDAVPHWPWPEERPYVSGSLYTTARDFASFLRAVLSPVASPFPAEVLQLLREQQVAFDESIGWSLGFGTQSDERFGNGARTPAFTASRSLTRTLAGPPS